MSAAAIGDPVPDLIDDYREVVTRSEGVDELVTLDGVREASQPLADRINRRTLMITANLGSIVALALLFAVRSPGTAWITYLTPPEITNPSR